MQTRTIPSSQEALPVMGLGTYRGFDTNLESANRSRLSGVLDALFTAGGTVIDSSPMYGQAEAVVGELLAGQDLHSSAFLATKVWTQGREAGRRQMEHSFRLLRTQRIDLMQIHNLVDWKTHLPALRDMKDAGRIRYIGITHYSNAAYGEVERILKTESLDFLQINYALDAREAEARVLPLAQDKGVAVLCNMPFGGGGLLRRLNATPMPGWAQAAGATSWAQLALQFVLAHPAITCVIPGTGKPQSMAENAAAADGMLTASQRQDLIRAV
jgi:aryl-alcohol dehydrogenase-like predicted oxidoreductase